MYAKPILLVIITVVSAGILVLWDSERLDQLINRGTQIKRVSKALNDADYGTAVETGSDIALQHLLND
jgi:hypothetical protein